MNLRRRRLLAFAAGGLVLGLGATVTTLASWTDTEWVWGGTGDGASTGLTASRFNMQQNTGATDDANWTDLETAPGGQLNFTLAALKLSPSDTIYAFMQVRPGIASADGDVALAGATASTGTTLFTALRYGAKSHITRAQCTAANYAANGTLLVASNTALTSGSAATTFEISGATATVGGTPVGVCFQVTLPAGSARSLQGVTTQPVWSFTATSK
jgi:hypothetical protein